MTRLTLVAGGAADTREAAIAAQLALPATADATAAVILEGLPDGAAQFDPSIQIVRLAPGCPCCTGNLALRVTLNRVLRHPPTRLFIGIADATHIGALRAFLTHSPYDALLTLEDDLLL
jgi:hypothetical protein